MGNVSSGLSKAVSHQASFQSASTSGSDYYSGSFFEPDIMLPGQYREPKRAGITGGERRLMAAMLTDAVDAYLQQAVQYVKGKSTRLDAIEWVESDDSSYVFSFNNVCASLGINPRYLRMGLLRYVAQIRKKARKHGSQGKNASWKRIRRPRLR